MIVCKHTQFKVIEIWSPRFHDKKTLIGVHHIKKKLDNYVIRFTDKNKDGELRYPGDRFIKRKDIVGHKTESNGTIDCYVVPMSKLTDKLEVRPHCEHEM